MSEEERRALLETLQASTEEAKNLTKEEATRRLIDGGFLTESGKLSPSYGGASKDKS